MVVSTPPSPPQAPDSGPDAGVIEDARARQRRWRRITGLLVSAAAVVIVLMLAFSGGRGHGGRGSHAHGQPGGGGGGPAGGHGGGQGFPGAPTTQPGSIDWAESEVCSLARRNRYLPAHSGCVTVTRANVFGGGGDDLVVVYSTLGHQPADFPTGSRSELYPAKQAMLEIVRPGGVIDTIPIRDASQPTRTPGGVRVQAASVLSVAHASTAPGEQIFLQAGGISSGSWGTIYDAYHGRLVHAGNFAYGGDSGLQADFGCLPGDPPKLIQYNLEPVGMLYRPWRGTKTTYVWRRGLLVRVAERKVTVSSGSIPLLTDGSPIGVGCLVGIGSYRTATGGTTTPVSVSAPRPTPAPASTGLGRDVFLGSITSWNGTLYGSGAYDAEASNPPVTPTHAFSGCRISCDPTIWVWSATLRRWQLVFVNHGTPGGSDQLLADGSSLFDFITTPGTKLFRTTNGRTYTLTRLPPAMAAGILTEAYLTGGSLVAIVTHGNQRGYENAPVVWTSTHGMRWTPAEPVAHPRNTNRPARSLARGS
ncbi:MAG: hypothetical protein ACRDQX_10055 [Pseudonocardiaceae bacterium]